MKRTYFVEEIIANPDSVDFMDIQELAPVYLRVLPKTKSRGNDYCIIVDSTGKKVNLTKLVSGLTFINDGTIHFESNTFGRIFQLIQNGQFQSISNLTFWVREELRSNTYGRKAFLDPLLGEPGKKITLGKDAKKGNYCKACGGYLLQLDYKFNDLKLPTCPYCDVPLSIVSRPRKYAKVALVKDEQVKISTYNIKTRVKYRNRMVPIEMSTYQLNTFYRNLQHNLHDQLGPFLIEFEKRHLWDKKLHINKIEPIILENSTWHEMELFPEDMLM